MAILTTTEAMALGQFPAAKSALVADLIPIVQDAILEYCRNHFIRWEIKLGSSDYVFEDDTITDNSGSTETFTTEFFPTDGPFDVAIRGSYNNNRVFQVESRTATVLTLSSGHDMVPETPDRGVTVYLVQFPKALKFPATQMIGFAMQKYSMAGVEQFSLADWSVTLGSGGGDAGPGGWPTGLLMQLNRWRTPRLM